MLGKALPELKELSLLTDDLRISHLRKLNKEAPGLRKLAVAPYIRDDVTKPAGSEGAAAGDWDWGFKELERFGALFVRQTSESDDIPPFLPRRTELISLLSRFFCCQASNHPAL